MLDFLSIKVWMWIAGVVGAAFLATAGGWYVRGIQLKDAKADIRTLESDLASALRTINSQKQVLQVCSDRTDALKAEGDKRAAAADQELLRLRKLAERYQASDRRLAVLTASPSPPGAKCTEAIAAIRRELRK